MTVDVDAEHARLVEAIPRHMRKDGTVNYTTLGQEFDRHRSNIKKKVAKLGIAGALGTNPVIPGFEIKETSAQYRHGEMVAESIKQRPAGEVTPVEREGFGISQVTTLRRGNDGSTVVEWVQQRPEKQNVSVTREAIQEMFAEYRGRSEVLMAPRGCDPDRLTLIPTTDLHLGMLAWGRDSGKDWDLAIAKRELLKSTSELIQLTPATQTAIMLDLGDQFHTNDQSNVTPMHKHRLDVDGRFTKVVKAGVDIRRAMIEMALQHFEIVEYRGLGGNHDPEAQMWLSVALSMLFENNPRVIIDDDPSEFWAKEFGKVFLFANHGHKVKPDRLPGLMAADHPEIWGRTKHKFAFSGHLHREKSGEDLGVIWETLRPFIPGDNFAHTGGWRSGRQLTSITYSAETGLKHRQYVPV